MYTLYLPFKVYYGNDIYGLFGPAEISRRNEMPDWWVHRGPECKHVFYLTTVSDADEGEGEPRCIR